MSGSNALVAAGLACCVSFAAWTGSWARTDATISAVQLAQSDCQSRADSLNAEMRNFNSQCSGELDQAEYARCQTWKNDLERRIADFNRRCAR